MIALTLAGLFESAVIGFTVTFVGCFVFDGQQAANLGAVAELSWLGSVIVYLLRQRGVYRNKGVACALWPRISSSQSFRSNLVRNYHM
jgi:hypothetical protein